MMNRRQALQAAAGALASGCLGQATVMASEAKATGMGIVIYCLGHNSRLLRQQQNQDISDPVHYLEYCRQLGAGGVQLPLGTRDEPYATDLRRRAEAGNLFIEGIIGPPRDEADLERFEAEVRTARWAGATVARTVIIPGRRYEQFKSADEFQTFARRGARSLELAEPVVAKHGLRLAVENHKDQRVPERLELLQRLSSEFIGACFDVGNSFSLLEDPLEVARAYAPWAASVHLKDQAVQEYEDGFLFADIALGEGFLDLAQMVAVAREANPEIHCSLEVITRDALKVPCLTETYWATFADVPGRDLARTLRTVRANPYPGNFAELGPMSAEERAAYELGNVKKCLAYARDRLKL